MLGATHVSQVPESGWLDWIVQFTRAIRIVPFEHPRPSPWTGIEPRSLILRRTGACFQSGDQDSAEQAPEYFRCASALQRIAKGNGAERFPRDGRRVESGEFSVRVVALEVDSTAQRLGQTGHLLPSLWIVVDIAVALPVSDGLHERCDSVAQVQGHRLTRGRYGVRGRGSVGSRDGIGLGGIRQVDCRLREWE